MDNSLPEVPDYVLKSFTTLKETGCIGNLSLEDITRLLLDWAEKYGDDDYTITVIWLSINESYFEQLIKKFLA